jgi:hypothetical protein
MELGIRFPRVAKEHYYYYIFTYLQSELSLLIISCGLVPTLCRGKFS